MSPPLVRAAIATLGVAVALAVAWFLPMLAAATVWPILFVVPGWAVIAWTQPRIDGAGRIGLAVVLSIVLSTHLVYWLSLAVGAYGRETVFATAAALALPIPIAAWGGIRPPHLGALRGAIPGLAVATLAVVVVGGTLAVGMWRVTPEGVYAGGSNWSDLGVHLSIAETLNAGANFPPEVPYFAGVPLIYHWFADFHAAIVAEAAGMFSVPAMVLQSTILAAALALLVWSLARRLLRGRDARRTATIAAGIAVFAGGLGWLRFVGDLSAGLGPPLELIAQNSYDNQWLTGWPYFRIPSVMGTGLLAHRATTAGLPIFVGAVLLLVAGLPTARQRARGWRDRPALIGLAGVLGALLAPFHFFFFPVLPLLALAFVLIGGRLVDRDAPRNALALLAPYALALPFVTAPALQASGSGAVRFVAWWPSAPIADGPAAVAFFYLTNLGVPFVLALAALLVPGLPRRAFLAVWLIGLFAIPNVVQLSVIDFDMNKYFQAMWIAVALLAAWLMRRWPAPALAAVLVVSMASPLLVAAWTATSRLQVISTNALAAAEWVSEHTPPGSVFVTDGWLNSLTDPAGRLRLTTFAPYVANLGYAPDERISHVQTIYCGGSPSLSADLMRRYGAAYLIDAGLPQSCAMPTDFASAGAPFELVYENRGLRIWHLGDP
ncbi:MAG: hypothetical protein ACRDGV_02255 [Candidatus Limnocylindria bacterium]